MNLQQSFSDKILSIEDQLKGLNTSLEDEVDGFFRLMTAECTKLQTQIDLIQAELLEIDAKNLNADYSEFQNQLNAIKLWSVNETKWVRCGNLNEVSIALTGTNYTELKYILTNVEEND